MRDRQDIFSGAFAYSPIRLNLALGGEVRNASTSWVSGDFFRTLGVNPLLGRTITAADDKRGCPAIAVLSYDFWQREYAGAADVFDRRLTLNSQPVRIVGVAPPGFNGIQVGEAVEIYAPLCAEGTLIRENSALDKRANWWIWIFARLKPGIGKQQALARMNTLAPQIFAATMPPNYPSEAQKYHLSRRFDLLPGANGFSNVRREYKPALYALMVVVGVVLLIACANVANLLISRAAVRRKEIAIRMAIGAGRARLIRQLLTESLLLSSMGAVLGVLFAQWASRMLVSFLSTSNSTVILDLSIDVRVLAFTMAAAVATGILFGLAPAWQGTRVDPHSAMKANARGVVESHARLEPRKGAGRGASSAVAGPSGRRRAPAQNVRQANHARYRLRKEPGTADPCGPPVRERSSRPPPAALSGITAASRRRSRRSVCKLRRYHPDERKFLEPDRPRRRVCAEIAVGFGRVDQFDQCRILRHDGNAFHRRPRFQLSTTRCTRRWSP